MIVDNRWSSGGLGERVPETALAAYGARWIDHGTHMDVVPDRQGFRYDNETGAQHRAKLIDKMIELDLQKVATTLEHSDGHQTVYDGHQDGFWVWMRRTGGYVYVAAWIEEEA